MLSQVVWDDSGSPVSLRPVWAHTAEQNMSSCNLRSAGVVFARDDHRLELVCSGRHQQGSPPTRFEFRVGMKRLAR